MKNFIKRVSIAGCHVYLALLLTWVVLHALSGDRFTLVALANTAGVYWFLPLPLIWVVAPFVRRREVWLGAALGSAAFLWLFGGLFVPRPPGARALGDSLSVMTWNIMGWRKDTAAAVAVIREEQADVVLLQELNPPLARALQSELGEAYPYMQLQPEEGFTGLGVLSRYPLRATDETLPFRWLGQPQVLALDWNGRQVTLVNFHSSPPSLANLRRIAPGNRYREAQALALVDLAGRSGLFIAAGDANTTPLSDAYRILAGSLVDAWAEAGAGLGHTYPGQEEGYAGAELGGRPAPQWLVRIDYVFHSKDWQALEARTTRADGISDHRGVVAKLVLRE
jgi:endonuclease/exonuclease/phosphatase (EEP) superfamily protein YafD